MYVVPEAVLPLPAINEISPVALLLPPNTVDEFAFAVLPVPNTVPAEEAVPKVFPVPKTTPALPL